MNIIKKIILAKKFHLLVLGILAITSFVEVVRDFSNLHSLTDIGAHHGILLFALATFLKETWEITEITDELHSEKKE